MARTKVSEKQAKGANGLKTSTNDQGDKKTDYARWRLLDERGRQTWHYLRTDEEVKNWPQSVADKWFLGLPTVRMAIVQTKPESILIVAGTT
jgi:lanosterol synthase